MDVAAPGLYSLCTLDKAEDCITDAWNRLSAHVGYELTDRDKSPVTPWQVVDICKSSGSRLLVQVTSLDPSSTKRFDVPRGETIYMQVRSDASFGPHNSTGALVSKPQDQEWVTRHIKKALAPHEEAQRRSAAEAAEGAEAAEAAERS